MIQAQAFGDARPYSDLIQVLGRKYLRTGIDSPYDFIVLARKGIDSRVILNFRKYFDLSRSDTAELLDVSEPTIYRWIRLKKKLDRNATVRVLELTDLFLRGADIFGSQEHFLEWLALDNPALGGEAPKELLVFPEGISKVRDLLGRIEHGVYS